MFEGLEEKLSNIFSGRLIVPLAGLLLAVCASASSTVGGSEGGPGLLSAEAGKCVTVPEVRVVNGTSKVWEPAGGERAVMVLMLLDANGSPLSVRLPPARLHYPTPAGSVGVFAPVRIPAPALPGRYALLEGVGLMEKGRVALLDVPVRRVTLAIGKGKPAPR